MALVSRDGFEEAAAELEAALATCDFVAIDCEMTGITSDDSTRPMLDDTPEARYLKCAHVASKFQLMQVGICPMHQT